MRLYAISDLHLANEINRRALEALPSYPDDWLILSGDIGETEDHLRFALVDLEAALPALAVGAGQPRPVDVVIRPGRAARRG